MSSVSKLTPGDAVPAFTVLGETTVSANRAALALLGFSHSDAIPPGISQLFASLTGRTFVEEFHSLRSTPGQTMTVPALLLGADCRVIPAMLVCRAVGDAILIEATDVESQSVLKHGMIDAAALARAAVEIAPGAVIATDELGTILSSNTAAHLAFGYSAEDLVGQNVAVLMTAQDAAAHDDHVRRYFHTGERHIIGAMRVVEARRRSGETFSVELYVNEVRYGDRRLYVGFLRDISRTRQLQAETTTLQRELIHVTRLASMGEMAAALAHELNQPLAAVTAYAEAARAHLARPGKAATEAAQANLEKAAAQAVRAGEVIRHMRQLASGGAGQRDPEGLNVIVREAVALATIGTSALGIATAVIEDRSAPIVICDRIQIQQVVINLVRNAIDACTDAAKSASSPPRRQLIEIETCSDGQHATVCVRDSGPGVPEELRERLFESFLTTKTLGVGLGLSISRMIIESHGGRLWLHSGGDRGAEFRFTLPLEVSEPSA
jgi:two-component system sensor kinase FixL